MKPRRIFSAARLSLPFASALVALFAGQSAQAASQTWGANSNSAWYTGTNWAGGAFPGSQGAAASNTDIATFTSAFTGTAVGMNMNAATAYLNLGAISVDSTRTTATTIGNTSTTVIAGNGQVLRLYGATVNSVANTIVRNAGSGLLTIQNTGPSGTQFMGVVLGNTTNNINIDGAGGVTISSIISQITAGSGITKGGSGAGILTLSGANTYTGTTTINTGTLRATTSASALGAGALSLGGGTLQLANDTDLNFARNTTVTATSTITADRVGTAAATSRTHTLGTLSIGAQTLNITRGAQINGAGVGGITFGATTLTGAAIFDTAASTNLTLGAVGGNFVLTKQGTGTLILSSTNSSTAATNINAGQVTIQNATSLGTTDGNTVVASGGRLAMATANLSIAEALNLTGTGTTATNGALNFGGGVSGMAVTGAITLGGAARIQGDGNTGATLSGGIDLGANALTYNVDGGATHAITTAAITGTGGSLAKSGGGTLNLTASNDYTGLTTVSGGTLAISHADALGGTTNGTTVTAGTLSVTSGITTNSAETISIAGAGAGNIGALQAGTGGGTWAGTVNLDTTPRIGATAGNTLTVTGSIVNGTGNTFAVSGESGTGVVVLNPTTSNTYTGNTGIIRGILRLGKTDALPTGTTLDVDSADSVTDAATFDMAGFNQTVAALQDTAAINVTGRITNIGGTGASTSLLTVNQSVATNFGGVIEDGAIDKLVALTKSGTGVLTLSGTNTHTGGTTISNGALSITTTGALPGFGTNGSYSVANGATLAVYNAVTDGDITSMLGTTNFAAGSSLGFDTTTANRTYGVILADTAQGALGLAKLGANALTINQANTYTGATTISAGTLTLSNVNALGGNTPGVNGTSGITMVGGTILAPSVNGVVTNAPITVGATGTTVTINAPNVGSNTGLPLTASVLTLGGAITGAGNVTFNSTQNQNNNTNILLNAQSSYLGSTLMNTASNNAGNDDSQQLIVRLGIDNALPATTVLTIDGGTGAGTGRIIELLMNGYDQTLAGLNNVTRNLRVQRVVNSDVSAASTLTINGSGDSTYGGAIGVNSTGNATNPVNFPGGTNGNNILLTKNGIGTFTLTSANTFSGRTLISGGILSLGNASALSQSPLDTLNSVTGDLTNGLRTTVTTLTLGGLTGNKNFADIFTTTSGGYNTVTALTLNPVTGATPTYSGAIADGAVGMTLTKTGPGTQTLSGANSYTGATTISAGTLILSGANTSTGTTAANAGALTLDYSSQDNSKLSDTAALTLGAVTLDLSGGTHAEVVLSTTLTAGTASSVTRSSGTAVLQMNAITNGALASIDFGASGIATTDTLNNTLGILGPWATIAGADFAVNSTNLADGLITAPTYTDVTRLDGTPALQIIGDAASQVRIIEGSGNAASITLGAATTTIGTLTQSASGGASNATIDSGGQTLRTNAILVGTGAGTLTIGNGTLNAAAAGGDLALASNIANGLIINSVIADNTSASTLSKLGTGTVILTNANTYTGVTTISAGTLQLGAGGTTGTLDLTSAIVLANSGNLTINRSNAVTQGTDFSTAAITGTGSFTQAGAGTTTLNAVNTYSGTTTIAAGILNANSTDALGSGVATNRLIFNGGTLQAGGSIVSPSTRLVTLTSTGVIDTNGNAVSFAGVASGAGGLTKNGAGTLTSSALNTFTGPITINSGELAFSGASGNLYLSTQININNGSTLRITSTAGNQPIYDGRNYTFDSTGGGSILVSTGNYNAVSTPFSITTNGGNRNTIGLITTSGTLGFNLGSTVATFNVALGTDATSDLTVDPRIGNTGSIVKTGTGRLALTGNNTYTGATTVSLGTLLVNNTTGSGTGTNTVSVDSGATLGGTGIISGAVNVSGVLSPGASIETLYSGTLSFANGSSLSHELDSSVAASVGSDLMRVTGDLNLAGTVGLTLSDFASTDVVFNVNDTFSLINYTGTWNGGLFTFEGNELAESEEFSFGLNNWRINYSAPEGGLNYATEYAGGADSFVNLTVVPEPNVAALIGAFGAMLLLRRRR